MSSGHLLAKQPQETGESGGTFQALSHPGILFIAVLCFFIFLIEGAMLDWSAVFLHTERGMEKAMPVLATPFMPSPSRWAGCTAIAWSTRLAGNAC